MESRVLTGATIRGLALPLKPSARLTGNCTLPATKLTGRLSDGGNLIWGRQLRPAILLEASPASATVPPMKRESIRPCSANAEGSDSAG